MTSASPPPNDHPRPRSLRRRLALIALAIAIGLVAMKGADALLGALRNTQQRHFLRLAPSATVRHRGIEFDYVFRTNSVGLRGPDLPFDKPARTVRIVVIGDSFIAGYEVSDDELLTARLQDLLNERGAQRESPLSAGGTAQESRPPGRDRIIRFEVINLGRAGTSTVRELDLYEQIGRRFEPDVVVLAYFLGNDLVEIMHELSPEETRSWHPDGLLRRAAYFWCPNAYLELAMWRQAARDAELLQPRTRNEVVASLRSEAERRGLEADWAERRYDALPTDIQEAAQQGLFHQEQLYCACLEPERLVRSIDPGDEYFDRAWPRTERYLNALREAVESDGARLAVVAIPHPAQVTAEQQEFYEALGHEVRGEWLVQPGRTEAALRQWARHAGVAYLDLTGPFREAEGPMFYRKDVHFNPDGHELAARLIAEFLEEQELMSDE